MVTTITVIPGKKRGITISAVRLLFGIVFDINRVGEQAVFGQRLELVASAIIKNNRRGD